MTAAAIPDPLLTFDRATVRRRRERAARAWGPAGFLKREAAGRLVERLGDVRRSFPLALDLGCHAGEVRVALAADGAPAAGVRTLIQADLSPAFAALARTVAAPALACDEEALPFAPASLDLVVSALALHWVNDLPGALIQIRRVLRPDGLFLAAMLGGETLHDLREALAQAESDVEGGLSPRVSPFADLRDAAGLLQRAGFALPVADVEPIEAAWADPLAMMRELRAMGESNAVAGRRGGLSRRETLMRAAEIYARRHARPDGRVVARFDLLWLHGWAPSPDQPKALRPGSARTRLADALGATEFGAGEKAAPR